MPVWVVKVRSRSGRPVHFMTKAPEDSFAVYSPEDLERVLRNAETDPRDLEVTYRREEDWEQ